MQGAEEVVRQLVRYEPVEWHYDGLNGKIIPWTKANGGTSDDPSALAFVVGRDGKVLSASLGADTYQPKAFAEWLKSQADAYEKAHPRTRIPFVPAEVARSGEGTGARVACAALDAAREAGRPAAVYVGREERPGDDREAKAEIARCRKFERETLGSAKAAEEAEGWTLLRLDRADPDHGALAKSLGAEEAPAVVLVVPGEEPIVLDGRTTGGSLAYRLKKHGGG